MMSKDNHYKFEDVTEHLDSLEQQGKLSPCKESSGTMLKMFLKSIKSKSDE